MRNKDLSQGSDVGMKSGEEVVRRPGNFLAENSKGRVQDEQLIPGLGDCGGLARYSRW